jgi:hypothetical protein
VRQAAAWAYGFAGGADALLLLREKAERDPSGVVRAFAGRALTTVTTETAAWWLV